MLFETMLGFVEVGRHLWFEIVADSLSAPQSSVHFVTTQPVMPGVLATFALAEGQVNNLRKHPHQRLRPCSPSLTQAAPGSAEPSETSE